MEKYILTITCFNTKGQQYKEHIECDDMVGVSRAMITFDPKRGYEAVRWTVEKEVFLEI